MLLRDRIGCRLANQALRLAGLVVMLLCALGLLAPYGFRADAQTTTVTFTLPPSPTPSPSPSPTPKPTLQTIKGGPINFSLNGSLQFGAHYQNSTYGGLPTIGTPSPSASPSNPIQALSQNQSQTNQSAGFLTEVSRRTGTTVTDLKFPVGFGSNGTLIGTVNAYYSTPKYSAVYGPQPLVLFGQLPLGSTERGLAFVVPSAFGDETLFEGPAIGAEGETLRLLGFRLREARGSTYYEAGIITADGPATGKSRTLTFGAAAQGNTLSVVGEGVWQQRSGGDGSPNGLGFQVRMDDGNSTNDFETTIRHLPDRFVAFGAGEIFGDNYLDTNWHFGGSSNQIAVDANWEHLGTSPTQLSSTRIESLLYSGSFSRLGGYGLSLQQMATAGGGQSQLTNSASLQTSLDLGAVNMLLGAQLTRSVQNPTGTIASVGYTGALQRQFGLFGSSITFLTQRTTQVYSSSEGLPVGTPVGPTTQVSLGAGLSRIFGKTGLGLTETIVHTASSTSNAVQMSPLVTVSRQISPVISVQTSYGIQTLRDKLNPSVDGHTRLFSFQINAPFSYGSGITSGRVDPRLPATIIGRVQTVATGNGLVAGFASAGIAGGGLSNVLITLDGRYMQRTDLTGGFQFSFVPAGEHTLRIDTSSIPRGLTVDQPVATVTLQGGQVSQVLFQVGNFGGIIGHVYGLGPQGGPLPLPNVEVRLDDNRYSKTDATGAFGFGGLQQGKHMVQVIENTVPAFATFDPAQLKQTVQVHNGGYTDVSFKAVPLGSISGKIVYGPEMLPLKGGVPNAYVVAEPGEHAAIDEDDGSFIIDDLPPGSYTLSVDPETLPEQYGAKPDSIPVTLIGGHHVHGIDFSVGRFEKKVVFTFLGGTGGGATSAVELAEDRLPPRGTTEVRVHAPPSSPVTVTAFGRPDNLQYDQNRKEWVGEIFVPADAKAGKYDISGSVSGAAQPAPASLTIDPKIPLAILYDTPHNAAKGQYVMVRARFLVDVHPGDKIKWQDGQVTVLGKPVSGRVFTFSVLLSLRPLHGVLLTTGGKLPIELL
jgi:hypothetical protein